MGPLQVGSEIDPLGLVGPWIGYRALKKSSPFMNLLISSIWRDKDAKKFEKSIK
jgi:hypothetical protein